MPALDPHKNTREEFTQYALSHPVPDNAHKDWLKEFNYMMALVPKLAYHPAMAPNLQQTYMTPAAEKNSVYFMWDFVSRTLSNLYNQVDPELKLETRASKNAWNDVRSRGMMATELILDTTPGMLAMMTGSAYPEQKDKEPAFGEDILELCRKYKTK
ncbi:hypothetical protein EJ05DRAFT_535066 [Pseudovirgaria hyperparasitica]|uniref:Uncharacterized protein n=1 Tax=Pseudovirgaria hyperparasitica TaxID=470096 RepID=A0A6A6WJ06_9PEZI|nr:uncharacterized protein EJ05DRAFT_535066 [Pseudovirgaria hyperparasitica]KAF2761707.1 hypothetical protein EJ05DRAFT_535066 [Pseudovirgaria hyperparasitica]